tara:strand:- start:1220 stop:1582 length:363 start_codon:yes stop_codon:yes gene_type:complete
VDPKDYLMGVKIPSISIGDSVLLKYSVSQYGGDSHQICGVVLEATNDLHKSELKDPDAEDYGPTVISAQFPKTSHVLVYDPAQVDAGGYGWWSIGSDMIYINEVKINRRGQEVLVSCRQN